MRMIDKSICMYGNLFPLWEHGLTARTSASPVKGEGRNVGEIQLEIDTSQTLTHER